MGFHLIQVEYVLEFQYVFLLQGVVGWIKASHSLRQKAALQSGGTRLKRFTFVQRERQNQQKWRFLIEALGKKFKCMTSTWQDNAIGDSMIAAFNEVQDLSTSFTSLMSLSSLLVVCSACRICEQKNLKCWRCRWVCECGLQSHPHSSSWATQDKQE